MHRRFSLLTLLLAVAAAALAASVFRLFAAMSALALLLAIAGVACNTRVGLRWKVAADVLYVAAAVCFLLAVRPGQGMPYDAGLAP